jgi:hypothetical protein
MLHLKALIVAACIVVGASCAMTPYSGQQISTNTVQFDGLTDTPGATVRIDAYDWWTNSYYAMSWVTTGTTPYLAAGAVCPNSPALYQYVASVPLQWSVLWKKFGTQYQAKVRATQLGVGETALKFTANSAGANCMAANAFNSTCDFYTVAYSTCGYALNEATIIGKSTSPWQ